jgi:uncharacterized protein (DUF488 family)
MQIWTIGHSNRPLDEFLGLLAAHEIEALADVRRHPGSRKWPHFSAEALDAALGDRAIEYHAFPDLGGRRKARPDSRNTAWKSESFRGYADYMESREFETAFERLTQLAARRRTAFMCAEAPWWRCHRSLIADLFKSRGAIVLHIDGPGPAKEHPYTPAARIVRGRLSYEGGESEMPYAGT